MACVDCSLEYGVSQIAFWTICATLDVLLSFRKIRELLWRLGRKLGAKVSETNLQADGVVDTVDTVVFAKARNLSKVKFSLSISGDRGSDANASTRIRKVRFNQSV